MPETAERTRQTGTGTWRRGAPPLRVLAVTRLFPNRAEPTACSFQRQQLAALSHLCQVEVVSPIPWLPGSALLGTRSRSLRLRDVPAQDEVEGIPVLHPRIPYVPGAGALHTLAALNAPLYLAGLLRCLPRLRGRFDVVLGAFLYPDAFAAAVLARALGVPYVVKTHGTDVNVVAGWPGVRTLSAPVLRAARWSFGVSRPMVDALIRLGAPPERAILLPNGVDRGLFHPRDRIACRRALGLPEGGRLLVFVGDLLEAKGVRELAGAFRRLGDAPVRLALVGEGPLRAELAALGDRVILAGSRPLADVARWIGAGDLLTLPSHREGTPNVILEALASGRPVVATRIGGIPDLLTHGRTGLLVPPRDEIALAAALAEALARPWDEAALVAAAPPSWDESAAALHRMLLAARG